MIDFIKRIDFMGREFKFNIKGGDFNTVMGGILSIVQAIGFLILLWYHGQDIYARKEPALIIRNYMKDEYPKVELNSKNFNFALRVEDYYGKTIVDPSAFYLSFEYLDFTYDAVSDIQVKNKTGTILREMEDDCSLKHFDNQTLHSYKFYKYKCIENNYTIGGSYGAEFLKAPSFYVRKCDDYAEKKYNVKCKTKDEIFKAYGRLYTSFFFQKNFIDPGDYINPLKPAFYYHYNGIDLNATFSVQTVINYSTSELTTDTGFVFSDTSTFSFLEFESRSTDEIDRESYHAIDLYVTRSFRAYYRTYVRISDALANVGGIMSFFKLFIDIVFSYFYLDGAYQTFLQKVFLKLNREIRGDEAVKIKVELNIQNNNVGYEKDKSLSILKDSSFQGDHTENTNSPDRLKKSKTSLNLGNKRKDNETFPNKQIDKLIDYKNINIEEVKISSGEVCYFNFCCYKNDKSNSIKNVKFKLFQASKHEIDKQIEILDLIRMKNQFRLVQKILLNENQCFMLQNRELHRVIDTKIMTCEDENILTENLEKLNIQNLINYLRLRKMENRITGTDKLLYEYLDRDSDLKKTLIKEKVDI